MLIVSAIALMFAGTAATAQPLTAEREQSIKVAVNAAMDQYGAWFAAGRADLIAERTYLVPSVRLGETGLTVLASREEIRKLFEANLKTSNC